MQVVTPWAYFFLVYQPTEGEDVLKMPSFSNSRVYTYSPSQIALLNPRWDDQTAFALSLDNFHTCIVGHKIIRTTQVCDGIAICCREHSSGHTIAGAVLATADGGLAAHSRRPYCAVAYCALSLNSKDNYFFLTVVSTMVLHPSVWRNIKARQITLFVGLSGRGRYLSCILELSLSLYSFEILKRTNFHPSLECEAFMQ